MKILIAGLVKNPQFLRVKEEGEKKGHRVDGCYSSDLIIKASPENFSVSLRNSNQRLEEYDLIYLWAVSKRRWDWYTASYFLNKKYGTILVNKKIVDPSYNYYLSASSDYLKQVEEKLPFPKSAVIFSPDSIDEVIEDISFPVIVKASEGRQGRGVFKANDRESLDKKISIVFKESTSAVLREFIPNDGDIRIFTVGYQAIGAMKRTPTQKGEFRSNISVGGRGDNYDLDKRPDVKEIAEKLSRITQTEIAGVDIMLHKDTSSPYILEINPGPQFTGFEKFTGINAAGKIIEYFESLQK